MFEQLKISIDLMGGSHAPSAIIDGLNDICARYQNVHFILFGRENQVLRQLNDCIHLKDRFTLINCDFVVSDDEQPLKALKNGRESSMYKALGALHHKEVDACISCGNTGALMVMAKLILGTLPGIKRPAIVSIYPNLKNGSVILDLGANADCDAQTLYQFAFMGACYGKIMLKKANPSVGILNVGVEEYKGREVEKKAFELLKNSELNFHGFIEGHDIAQGVVDVVVTDGFVGNIVLKTSEGVGKMCQEFIKNAFLSSIFSKIGALFAKNALKRTFEKVDPRNYNGAMFIGVDGIVIKSHGSSDRVAFANAVEVAIRLAKQKINHDIANMLKVYYNEEAKPSLVNKIKEKLGFK